MSDELKDFRYYADKAEALLEGMTDLAEDDNEGATIITAVAAVFAELAKAAPKTEPEPRYIIVTEAEAKMVKAMKDRQKEDR
jgi:hypothetical protein